MIHTLDELENLDDLVDALLQRCKASKREPAVAAATGILDTVLDPQWMKYGAAPVYLDDIPAGVQPSLESLVKKCIAVVASKGAVGLKDLRSCCDEYRAVRLKSKVAVGRRYVTIDEAERTARSKWEQLWRVDNKREWARQIECDRRQVPKLKAWHDAEKRRDNWNQAISKLPRSTDPAIIEALHAGDASVISGLSEMDREQFDELSDDERGVIYNLLTSE